MNTSEKTELRAALAIAAEKVEAAFNLGIVAGTMTTEQSSRLSTAFAKIRQVRKKLDKVQNDPALDCEADAER